MFAVGSLVAGRYQLQRQLGGGGFATVYLATDRYLERSIALKVLHLHHAAGPERDRFLARFGQEARLVARLDHPHILGLHDSGEVEGLPYLVMPYIGGGTLAERLHRQGTLAPACAVGLIGQLAGALDYAHAQRVVHRDIKPANVLLRDAGLVPLLADFGIAKAIDHTTTGTAATGTVAYMSPEQFDGWVSPQSDVYALGCLCFELLTGEVPYQGTVWQTMYAHQHAAIPLLAARGLPEAPPQLQAALEGALAKDARRRYPNAETFARDVAMALDLALPLPESQLEQVDADAAAPARVWSAPRPVQGRQRSAEPPTLPSRALRGHREVVRTVRPRAGRVLARGGRAIAPLMVLALLVGMLGALSTFGLAGRNPGNPAATAPVVGVALPTATPAPTVTPTLPSAAAASAPAVTATRVPPTATRPRAAYPATTRVYVLNPDGEGTYLCRTTNRADRAVVYPNGTILEVLDKDVVVDGVWWTPVRDAEGRVGYIETAHLSANQPSATPSPAR